MPFKHPLFLQEKVTSNTAKPKRSGITHCALKSSELAELATN
jgi:hypothetical protein